MKPNVSFAVSQQQQKNSYTIKLSHIYSVAAATKKKILNSFNLLMSTEGKKPNCTNASLKCAEKRYSN